MSISVKRWETLLRRPVPCDHLLQVYTDDGVLIRALAHFIGSGLDQGDAAVVIATPAHIAALTRRLTAMGPKSFAAQVEGGLIAVDAERTLAKFMVNGMPDRAVFQATVVPLLGRLRDAGYDRIRLFGEMVNLLWRQSLEATAQLESLWNEVVEEYRACLLCAYRIDIPDPETKRGILHQITRSHSHSFSDDDAVALPPRRNQCAEV